MARRVVKNANVHGREQHLPRIIDIEILWPVAGAEMSNPLSKPFCLRYADATVGQTRIWQEVGRYMSLAGGQRDADGLVGKELSSSCWVEESV